MAYGQIAPSCDPLTCLEHFSSSGVILCLVNMRYMDGLILMHGSFPIFLPKISFPMLYSADMPLLTIFFDGNLNNSFFFFFLCDVKVMKVNLFLNERLMLYL